jgi:tetratricopeptide (TPR) repeat protein
LSKIKAYRILLLIILFLSVSFAWSQPQDNDTKLADHYYGKGEYEKAELYYKKAFKKYEAQVYFERYFQCLFYQQKFDECESLVEKRIRKDPYTIENQFMLADVYKETNREKEAEGIYKGLIKDLQPIQSRIESLGELFQAKGMYDYALETFLKGRDLIRKGYQFQLELAALYSLLDRPSEMIAEYLNLLDYSPVYLRTVQKYLSRTIDFEEDTRLVDILREEILVKIQQYPNEEVYNEMFIWYYLQKKEFIGAVMQAKALDKKKNERGKRLIQIGQVCQANKAYSEALKAYDYVVEMGEKSPYYHQAFEQKLQVQFDQVTEQSSYSREEVESVALDFESALNEVGRNQNSIGIMEQLANIYAFHLNEPQKGMQLVDQALSIIPGGKRAAELKILKADIHVVTNEIWEASLLYMQVEKDYSEEVIGHEAKFKNAKIFYYDGEFEYAKAQLDVLKASTSKLIANDAMQLSLLLQDNLGMDTTTAPVQLFANADLLLAQHRYDEAIVLLDSLEKRFPFHAMVDEVLFKKAQIYQGQRNWELAIDYYSQVVESYSHDILGDDAAFQLAVIYDEKLGDRQKASEYYKMILFDFSGSLYTAEARKKYREIVAEFN